MELVKATGKLQALQGQLNGVLKGKPQVVRLSLVCLLARGHLLIEDVPGVGKTTLALALARSIDCTFQRIQFTSDLMPQDITGVHIYNPKEQQFLFRPGPVFAQVVLADEINRTNPKTQSALLEAMNERHVSVDGKTFRLPEPFMVIATQNPLEHHGTFPLPESQLDRFMLHLSIGYPEARYEKEVLLRQQDFEELERLPPVLEAQEVIELQHLAAETEVEDSLVGYILELLRASRLHPEVRLGASTRAGQNLLRAAKAHALLSGRRFVVPDDIKHTASAVLGHRLVLKAEGGSRKGRALVEELLRSVAVPV
jgi:MoxR-like ATPase